MKQLADLPHLPLLWLCLFLGHHPLQVIFRKAGHYWPSTFVALAFLKNVLACDSIAIFFTCPNDSWSNVVFDALNVEAVLRKVLVMVISNSIGWVPVLLLWFVAPDTSLASKDGCTKSPLRFWAQSALFWGVWLLLLTCGLAFLVLFISNLNAIEQQKDLWDWFETFVWALMTVFLFAPFFMACLLTAAAKLAIWLMPEKSDQYFDAVVHYWTQTQEDREKVNVSMVWSKLRGHDIPFLLA
ncbi:unnamed protein product [Symbiodinium necroappetens]|uniref:Uncharacterized protein n=1 Tax=Symbiodinium necroappetens TaxID=1628268 RepID=A0A812WIH5_9DINO|nr:unnamed protein product [Symbiodinium necroappetens]